MHKNVLIVDDEKSVQYTVKRILAEEGYRVLAASSGDECLEILKDGFTGLILMDVNIPGMNGWQIVEEIVRRGYNKNCIICMLTGDKMPAAKMDYLKEHVIDYLTKPFDSDHLLRVVNENIQYLKNE